jgi:hypothetical protein
MAMMISEMFDALRSVGVDDERARKAAEAVATYDPHIMRLRSDVRLLKWQAGAGLALTAAAIGFNATTLWFVLRLVAKVGA